MKELSPMVNKENVEQDKEYWVRVGGGCIIKSLSQGCFRGRLDGNLELIPELTASTASTNQGPCFSVWNQENHC